MQIPEDKQPVFVGLKVPALHHLVPLSNCRDPCFQYKSRYSAHRNHRMAHSIQMGWEYQSAKVEDGWKVRKKIDFNINKQLLRLFREFRSLLKKLCKIFSVFLWSFTIFSIWITPKKMSDFIWCKKTFHYFATFMFRVHGDQNS